MFMHSGWARPRGSGGTRRRLCRAGGGAGGLPGGRRGRRRPPPRGHRRPHGYPCPRSPGRRRAVPRSGPRDGWAIGVGMEGAPALVGQVSALLPRSPLHPPFNPLASETGFLPPPVSDSGPPGGRSLPSTPPGLRVARSRSSRQPSAPSGPGPLSLWSCTPSTPAQALPPPSSLTNAGKKIWTQFSGLPEPPPPLGGWAVSGTTSTLTLGGWFDPPCPARIKTTLDWGRLSRARPPSFIVHYAGPETICCGHLHHSPMVSDGAAPGASCCSRRGGGTGAPRGGGTSAARPSAGPPPIPRPSCSTPMMAPGGPSAARGPGDLETPAPMAAHTCCSVRMKSQR